METKEQIQKMSPIPQTDDGRDFTAYNSPEFEPALRAVAATALADSLSYQMERKYLQKITEKTLEEIHLHKGSNSESIEIQWLKITQVGRPLEKTVESSFSAIQKILYSCFLPSESRLLFLIVGGQHGNNLFLGLSGHDSSRIASLCQNLSQFIGNGVWPGIQAETVTQNDTQLINESIKKDFQHICAITGVPSMESHYKQIYPATVDMLMAGMNQCKEYAYLVVADPIDPDDTDVMLCRCREMAGQAESLKSATVTDGISTGHSENTQFSHTHSTSITEKDKKALLAVAAGKFLLDTTKLGQKVNIDSHLLSDLIPSKTESTSDTVGHSEGWNESRNRSIGHNVVNKHIARISEHLAQHSERLEKGKAMGLWEVGVYLMSDRESNLRSGALQLRSLLSGNESLFEPIRIHNLTSTLSTPKDKSLSVFIEPKLVVYSNNKPYQHPLGQRFIGLTSVLTTKELSYLVNFPMRSVPGISVVDSSPEFSLNAHEYDGMYFGKLLYGGTPTDIEYRIPYSVLTRHILLSGINGSGKTNTVKAMLDDIGNRPFIVIEPAKTEYVDWAIAHNDKHPDALIDIYMPGCKLYKNSFKPKKLKINPFELIWLNKEQEPNVLTHIDRLKSTFAAAFPMYDILPILMEDLIYTLYNEPSTDWMHNPTGSTMYPTLNSMKICVDKVIENHKYEERVSLNMKACLNTRIDSLMRGWKGEMLNTVYSTRWDELFGRPTVINLSYVGDDVDKAFFMSLILQFLYEYRCAQTEIAKVASDYCQHLTIIEEAHRVMSRCDNPEMPQYKTAMMFSNMLSEIRAYGEGFLLVDQVPTRLIPDAIKNTNMKITHRIVAEDDCKAIGESMGLSPEQRLLIPKLLTGQCIVSGSQSTDVYWVKANKANN